MDKERGIEKSRSDTGKIGIREKKNEKSEQMGRNEKSYS